MRVTFTHHTRKHNPHLLECHTLESRNAGGGGKRKSLEASCRDSGSCTKECSFGEIIFASICNLSRNGCNYFLPCLLERTYGKISLKNVTLGHGPLMGITPQGFFSPIYFPLFFFPLFSIHQNSRREISLGNMYRSADLRRYVSWGIL